MARVTDRLSLREVNAETASCEGVSNTRGRVLHRMRSDVDESSSAGNTADRSKDPVEKCRRGVMSTPMVGHLRKIRVSNVAVVYGEPIPGGVQGGHASIGREEHPPTAHLEQRDHRGVVTRARAAGVTKGHFIWKSRKASNRCRFSERATSLSGRARACFFVLRLDKLVVVGLRRPKDRESAKGICSGERLLHCRALPQGGGNEVVDGLGCGEPTSSMSTEVMEPQVFDVQLSHYDTHAADVVSIRMGEDRQVDGIRVVPAAEMFHEIPSVRFESRIDDDVGEVAVVRAREAQRDRVSVSPRLTNLDEVDLVDLRGTLHKSIGFPSSWEAIL